MRRLLIATAAALLGGTLSVSALPGANQGSTPIVGNQTLIEKVHGCHRDVEHGAYGWHYHRGYNCSRVSVAPPRRHYPEHRGPRCWNECKYVGPIKVCKERCR